ADLAGHVGAVVHGKSTLIAGKSKHGQNRANSSLRIFCLGRKYAGNSVSASQHSSSIRRYRGVKTTTGLMRRKVCCDLIA
ncbi:hypothetical protein, partial [Burkholderia sp. SIMBA_019]|uniref:hypothetical protein n=1 Tax=Burkholderia sp. SIMBA_019 TaxID=3085765 RepID=UPI00397AEE5A